MAVGGSVALGSGSVCPVGIGSSLILHEWRSSGYFPVVSYCYCMYRFVSLSVCC